MQLLRSIWRANKQRLMPLVLLGCVCAPSAHALEWLSVQVPATYESAAASSDHIRKECIGLERAVGVEVAYQLEQSAFARVDRVEQVNLRSKGKLLAVTITQAGASAGKWTAPKSLSVKAELFNNGKSFEWASFDHTSRDQRDECEVLESNATFIAKDIYKWLTTTLKSNALPAILIDSPSDGGAASSLRQLQSHTLWISTNVISDTDVADQQLINSCNVPETMVDQAIAVFSKSLSPKKLGKVANADKDDDVLQFTIVDIKGKVDNSPEKRSMTLKTELFRDGKVIDTFNAIHSKERAGLLGQVVRNTCDALSNISNKMASDTYQWYVHR